MVSAAVVVFSVLVVMLIVVLVEMGEVMEKYKNKALSCRIKRFEKGILIFDF